MSNYEALDLSLTLSPSNMSKLTTALFKAQQAHLDIDYAFFRAIYDNLKTTKLDSKRKAMIQLFSSQGHVPDKNGRPVKFLGRFCRFMEMENMIICELTVDGKLAAPKKSDFKKPRPSSQTTFRLDCEEGEQSVSINTATGILEYQIQNNNHNVEESQHTWLYQTIYGFINSHKFGRYETGTQRYETEYANDSSYTYYGNALKHMLEKQMVLAKHFARKRARK